MKYLQDIVKEVQNEKLQEKTDEITGAFELKEEEVKKEISVAPKIKNINTKKKILFYIILTILITIAIRIIPGLI